MLRPLPVVIVVAASAGLGLLTGMMFGPSANDGRDLKTAVRADPAEVRRAATDDCAAILAERDRAKPTSAVELSEKDEKDLEQFALMRTDDVAELEATNARLEKLVGMAEEIAKHPFNRADYDVQLVSKELLDPLRRGLIYLKSTDVEIRRAGVRALFTAAQNGKPEAYTALNGLLTDADKSIARDALRQIRRLTGEMDDARAALLKSSGIEQSLVTMVGSLDGREQRGVLESLTELKNAAATPIWRTIFAKESAANAENQGGGGRGGFGGDDRVAAANALRKLGSSAESAEVVAQAITDFANENQRVSRRALETLTSIEDPQAKAFLEAQLANDPTGPNAGRIRMALNAAEGFGRMFGGQRPR